MVDALPGSARDRLESFHRLLVERAVPQGMISAADGPRVWERHIVDSVRGAACLPERAATVVDIGSGAGLPGIPVAISRPDLSVYLVEPRARRAAFLELTVYTLKLSNVRVVVSRAEKVDLAADFCLARAVASPANAWRLAQRLLSPGGRLLLWAGRSWPGASAAECDLRGIPWEICSPPGFPWQGPLVIMGGT
jgi:16S rRNA (guanine527-N7)-methyltransferase